MSVGECQRVSASVGDCQRVLARVSECQWVLASVSECWWVTECQSVSASVGECWRASVSVSECWRVSASVDERQWMSSGCLQRTSSVINCLRFCCILRFIEHRHMSRNAVGMPDHWPLTTDLRWPPITDHALPQHCGECDRLTTDLLAAVLLQVVQQTTRVSEPHEDGLHLVLTLLWHTDRQTERAERTSRTSPLSPIPPFPPLCHPLPSSPFTQWAGGGGGGGGLALN